MVQWVSCRPFSKTRQFNITFVGKGLGLGGEEVFALNFASAGADGCRIGAAGQPA